MTVNYVAVLLASYVLSLASFLLVEKPFASMEAALLAKLMRGATGSGGGGKRANEPARAAYPPPLMQAPPWQPLTNPIAAPAGDGAYETDAAVAIALPGALSGVSSRNEAAMPADRGEEPQQEQQ